jgi:hypothetical protein
LLSSFSSFISLRDASTDWHAPSILIINFFWISPSKKILIAQITVLLLNDLLFPTHSLIIIPLLIMVLDAVESK